MKAPHVKVALLHPGGVKTNIAAGTLHGANLPDNAMADRLVEFFHANADLTSEQAADWIIGAVKNDQYRVLVGYDAWLFDKMVRIFPESILSFYEQLGREGLAVDMYDMLHKNQGVVGPAVFARLMAAGLWTHLLFLWPVPILRLRHTAAGRSALTVMAATALYGIVTSVTGRQSKL